MAYRKTPEVLENLAAVRNALLDAAERIGIDASIKEIAAEAGTAVGNVYTHFPDMRELRAAVIARRLQLDLGAMNAAASAATKPMAAIAAAIAVYVNRARKYRSMASITADATYRAGIVREFEQRIAKASNLPAGRLVGDPQAAMAAVAIYGALNAVLANHSRTRPIAADAPALVLLALRAIGAPGNVGMWTAAGCALAETLGRARI